MICALSAEHEAFRRSVREFAEAEIAPHAAEWDRKHHFPSDVVQKMGALGLFGLTAPEEYGGAGLSGEEGGFTSLCLAIEEIGRVDQSMGITLEAAVGLGINPILTFGTDEQKQTWLPDLVSGRRLAGFGLTEPGSGSDAGSTRTKARVPEANLLGERGRGFAQFLATLDDGRVAIAALAVGCIQACLDMSRQYANERTTFGVPIGQKQGVAFQISDLEVMLRASRLLTYQAAAMKDAGRPAQEFKQAAAVAKLYATESAVTATRIATQVFGGYGFMEEYPVARFYRDAKVLEIGEGTSEVQRMLIARGLGLPVE